MKIPKHKFLGYSWVGWLNILILQWFFIRLAYITGGHLANNKCELKFLKRIVPLTGWWSDYKYWPKKK